MICRSNIYTFIPTGILDFRACLYVNSNKSCTLFMQGIEINILRNLFELNLNMGRIVLAAIRNCAPFAHMRGSFCNFKKKGIFRHNEFFRKVFIYICICYIALKCDIMAKDEEEEDDEEEEEEDDEEEEDEEE